MFSVIYVEFFNSSAFFLSHAEGMCFSSALTLSFGRRCRVWFSGDCCWCFVAAWLLLVSFLTISSSLSSQVPVPVFLPTSLDSSEKIFAAIEELRGKVPSNPLETELLTLSGMVPERDGKAEASDVASEFLTGFLALRSVVYVWICVNREQGWLHLPCFD